MAQLRLGDKFFGSTPVAGIRGLNPFSGEVQENAFPLELAHEEQLPAIFRDKGRKGEFFAGEPVYGKRQPLFRGEDYEVGFIFLYQGKKQINSKLDGVNEGLIFVLFSLPDFKLFLSKSRQPVDRNKILVVKQTRSPKAMTISWR